MAEYVFAVRDGGGLEECREEIVRCKDCVYQQLEYISRGPMICNRNSCTPWLVEPDGFCAWGEERDA